MQVYVSDTQRPVPRLGPPCRRGTIVCSMLPLAISSSGLTVIGIAVISALLLLVWLLRSESREEALEAQADERAKQTEPGS